MSELIQLHISLGVFDLFCDVFLFPSSVCNRFFSGCFVIYSVYGFSPGLLSDENLEDNFLVDLCECTGKRFV